VWKGSSQVCSSLELPVASYAGARQRRRLPMESNDGAQVRCSAEGSDKMNCDGAGESQTEGSTISGAKPKAGHTRQKARAINDSKMSNTCESRYSFFSSLEVCTQANLAFQIASNKTTVTTPQYRQDGAESLHHVQPGKARFNHMRLLFHCTVESSPLHFSP